jgi:ribosomal protein L16 Arg81 hydroxylase
MDNLIRVIEALVWPVTTNVALIAYFAQCAGALQECNLRRRMFMFQLGGRRRWYIGVRRDHAYAWQRGRFDGDIEFW